MVLAVLAASGRSRSEPRRFVIHDLATDAAFIESFVYRRSGRCKRFDNIWTGYVHVYGLLVRPMPWPLALMEIADRGLINGSRLFA